jgi:hypothetical protein
MQRLRATTYSLQPVYDARGVHVGFVDGPFVLDRRRRVVAELRAGVVVCLNGHVSGTYEADYFLDEELKVVAVARRALPDRRRLTGARAAAAMFRGRIRPSVRGWSRLSWRRYIAF